MNEYKVSLCSHLGQYRENRLCVRQMGTWTNNGKKYAHILPEGLELLNILEDIRHEMQCYLAEHPDIKLHKDFRHLNSSQAFAFNVFFPYFRAGGHAACTLSSALGMDAGELVSEWAFEQIQDEGTNADVVWRTEGGDKVFCEVKLSEDEFGVAADDDRHRQKLQDTYLPRLRGRIAGELLDAEAFFKHYQLLRYLSLIAQDEDSHLAILLPRANAALSPQLDTVMGALPKETARRVHIAYVEDVIDRLENAPGLSPGLVVHAKHLREKYAPATSS